jgi:hypothetical protein
VAHDPLAALAPVLDLAPVAWVGAEITEFGGSVARSLVPAGYEAYVRIDHGYPDDAEAGTLSHEELAALSPLLAGRTANAELVTFCLWEGFGYLHRQVSQHFGADGRRETIVTEPGVDVSGWPRLALPHRNYYVLRGPITAAPCISAYFMAPGLPWRDGPNLWWPDDRAWFVTSEIDLFATYVACTTELAEAIVADEALDASVVPPDAEFHDDGYWVRGR